LEKDITVELCVLQSHLDGMLNRIHHNSLTLKRLQAFEMRLLGLTSLSEMIDFILGETKELFNLDVVSLCLLDANNEIASHLTSDNYRYQSRADLLLAKSEALFKAHFDFSERPLLGVFHPDKYAPFFDSAAPCPSSVILAPLMRRGKYLGSLNFGSYSPDRFIQSMATDFIEHLASVFSVCLENTLTFETMRRTSLVDPLTGVNNRRFLEQRLEEELDRGRRSRKPLSCLFLDIDFFKNINDNFGHQAGDHVLAEVAASIKSQLRSNDVLSRYGGEEFVALLSESGETIASDIAERIRSNIAHLPIYWNGQPLSVTISIGTATYDPNRSEQGTASGKANDLIRAADSALYTAKRDGRNRVENWGVIGKQAV